jgi:ferric-dicitrate binding protein FerR (iron transport regulator)
MMTVELITDLLLKHLQGTLTVPEQQQLEQWLQQSAHNRHLFNTINNEAHLREQILLFQPEAQQQNEQEILQKIQQLRSNRPAASTVRRLPAAHKWAWAAAAVLLFMGLGAYVWMARQKIASPGIMAHTNDILPGKEGAVLTLADGRQVVLDSLGNGVVAIQNGARVVLKNGKLTYSSGDQSTGALAYNILSTPKGRQFQLTLPDGTRVWLNAASSLRYPATFSGNERRVAVTGEVYFEVAANSAMPFKVETGNGTAIQVLGTNFNINAYADAGVINTTLLNGSVKVMAGSSGVLLKPGQQAQTGVHAGTQQDIKVINNPDLDKVMAWKNGFFNFENATLEEVMHQLERWYDIEVAYEKQIPDIRFGGKLSRDLSLESVLKSLEETEVHFRIKEGRKLIVLP